jgi:rod shape-determining protein MreD
MAILFLMLATYLAAALQASLAPMIEVRHVMPDLFALVAVLWVLRPAGSHGFIAAGLVGLVYDLTSAAPLGIGLGLYSLAGYSIWVLRGKLDGNHLLVQLPIAWLATTIVAVGEAAAARLFGELTLPWTTLAVRAVSVGVYTTAVALPVLMVVGWLPRGAWRVVRGA